MKPGGGFGGIIPKPGGGGGIVVDGEGFDAFIGKEVLKPVMKNMQLFCDEGIILFLQQNDVVVDVPGGGLFAIRAGKSSSCSGWSLFVVVTTAAFLLVDGDLSGKPLANPL